MIKRLCSVLILVTIVIVSLTGCWSGKEIDTLAVAVCTGIDKVEGGYVLTQQVIDPKSVTAESKVESPVIVYSDFGRDLFEIKRKLTNQSPRKVYSSHLRMVVLGEDIAKSGIRDIIDFFSRGHEFRTDFYFVIAKGTTAQNLLGVLTPLETIPGMELYDSLDTSQQNWASVKKTRIIELINSIDQEGINPVITGLELIERTENVSSTWDLSKAVQIKNLKYNDLGAFKDDKLVGWLSEEESKGYNYIVGYVKSTVEHVHYDKNVKIALEVIKASSAIKVFMDKDEPVIEVTIKTLQDVETVEGQFDVADTGNKEIINKLSEDSIKQICNKSIERAQNELKSDIFGFGEAIHRQYPKLWDKIKHDWNNYFQKVKVNLKVYVKLRNLGQIQKTMFMEEKD